MPIQRASITSVEMDEEVLHKHLRHHQPHSLRHRGLPNLKYVHISLSTQRNLVKGLRKPSWDSDYNLEAHKKMLKDVEARLKAIEGGKLVVVFQDRNATEAT